MHVIVYNFWTYPNSTTTVNAKEKNNCKASESDANILLQFTNQIGIRGGISVQHILNNNNNNTNNVLISSSAEEIDDRDEESFDDDDDDNHFLSPLSSSSLSSNKNNGIHQTNDIQDKRTTMKRHNKKHFVDHGVTIKCSLHRNFCPDIVGEICSYI